MFNFTASPKTSVWGVPLIYHKILGLRSPILICAAWSLGWQRKFLSMEGIYFQQGFSIFFFFLESKFLYEGKPTDVNIADIH